MEFKESDPSSLSGLIRLDSEASRLAWRDVQTWVRDVILSLTIAFLFLVFLVQPVKVEGTSMLPELIHEERVIVDKILYSIDNIQRGDIVVFKFPEDPSMSYIKRVIGLAGETVEIRSGVVYINGKADTEPHVLEHYRGRSNFPALTVPQGEYFLLGDHRNASNDSRTWGTIKGSYITGKAVFAYWPPEQFGIVH